MTRQESSTGFGRVFVDDDLCADCREVYLNRERPTEPKIASGISHTVYPISDTTPSNQQPIHIHLKELN